MNKTITINQTKLDAVFRIWETERTQIEALVTAISSFTKDDTTAKKLCAVAAAMLGDTDDFFFAREIVEGRKLGTDAQIDNMAMQDEVANMMTERETEYRDFLDCLDGSEVRAAPSIDEYFAQKEATGAMLQKRIRYSKDKCPDCGTEQTFLNVGRDHFAVCFDCKTYDHYGQNLFSAWRDESPEVWAENKKTLDGMTDRPVPF